MTIPRIIQIGIFVPTVLSVLTLVGTSVNTGPFGSVADYLGLAVFLAGAATETVSELQRKAFKDDTANKGKVFTGGLFSLARCEAFWDEARAWMFRVEKAGQVLRAPHEARVWVVGRGKGRGSYSVPQMKPFTFSTPVTHPLTGTSTTLGRLLGTAVSPCWRQGPTPQQRSWLSTSSTLLPGQPSLSYPRTCRWVIGTRCGTVVSQGPAGGGGMR